MEIKFLNNYASYGKDFEKDTEISYSPEVIPTYIAYATFRKLDELKQCIEQFDLQIGDMMFRKEFRDEDRNEKLINQLSRIRYKLNGE